MTRAREEKEADVLRRTVREQAEHIAALSRQTRHLARAEGELRRRILELHQELERRASEVRSQQATIGARDHRLGELEGLVFGRDTEIALRERDLGRLRAETESLRREVEMMQGTRVWRLGARYWRLRDAVRHRVRPGRR